MQLILNGIWNGKFLRICVLLTMTWFPFYFTAATITCGSGTLFDIDTKECQCDIDLVRGDSGGEQIRKLQDVSSEDVVYLAGIFDITNFDWGRDIFDFTISLINNHDDGWHDDIFNASTRIEYEIADSACDETLAARAYWDLRTLWGGPMHGLVGCRCSGASIAMARIASLDGVPQISPTSVSPKLNDKFQFPYFSRMVGSGDERGDIGAMVAMLRYFGWDRVSIIAVDSVYATDYTTAFRTLWTKWHDDDDEPWQGEVASSYTIILGENKTADADSVKQALNGVPTEDPSINSRVILLIAYDQDAYQILQIAEEMNFQPDTIWAGSTSWVGRLPNDPSLIPQSFGYFGPLPMTTRSDDYQDYMQRLQAWQHAEGREVWTEFPDYAAEYTVDSIIAIAKAISTVPVSMRHNGSLVTQKLRNLSFDGISGQVRFSDEGNRLDPLFSIFNLQMINGSMSWVDVGTTGTSTGSASWRDAGLGGVCVGPTFCDLEMMPSDKYPIPPQKVDAWVIAVITIILALLLVVLLKYRRSRKKKQALKSSMSEIQKKMEAMKTIDNELNDIDDQVETAKRRQASLMQKRGELQEKPETWSDSDKILVEVPSDEDQYWEVTARMQKTMPDAHISKLWRIQNNSLWNYYSFHKDRLSMNGIKHNERSVWHGTSSLDPSAIYNDRQDGFMMQFSQIGFWGRGIYFADKSMYSHSYSYKPCTYGSMSLSTERPGAVSSDCEMFLAKLLVGNEVLLNRDQSSAKATECRALSVPPVDPKTNLKYNTVTGYTAGSQVWIVYENGRAYPDYLVRYYRGSRDSNRTPFKNKQEAKQHVTNQTKSDIAQECPKDIDIESGVDVTWEYLDNDDWKPYDESHQMVLESSFQSYAVTKVSKSSQVQISTTEWDYEVDVATMVQKNIKHPGNRLRDVRRTIADNAGSVRLAV